MQQVRFLIVFLILPPAVLISCRGLSYIGVQAKTGLSADLLHSDVFYINICGGAVVTEPSDIPTDAKEKMIHRIRENDRLNSSLTALQPYSLYFECPMYETFVRLEDAPDIHPFGQCRIHLCFVGKTRRHENEPYNLSLRWLLPEGFHVLSGRSAVRINQENNHSKDHLGRADFIIEAGESIQPVNRLVLEVVTEGHPTILYIPITLLG